MELKRKQGVKANVLVICLCLCFGQASSQAISDVLEKALGAVVTVAVVKEDFANKQLGFRGQETAISTEAYKRALDLSGANSSGSGFVIRRNNKKYVVTNAHVVQSASSEAGSLYIYSISRKKYEVRVVGGDSFYDFALLEFVDNPGDEIGTMDYRKKDARIGETVFAIGNPMGDFPYSVSDGIISAKNRVRGGMTGKFGFLQTTATVIWGNSGGPLIDQNGEVLGINSQIAIETAPDGSMLWLSQINFALESSISQKLTEDILANDGRVIRAYLGLEIVQNFQIHQTQNGSYLSNLDEHPIISEVLPRSPAYAAMKDKLGAYLLAVNNTRVNNIQDILGEFEKIGPNQTVELLIKHKNREQSVSIRTALLETNRLEAMAEFIIEKDEEIAMNQEASGTVSINYTPKQAYSFDEKKYNYSKKQASSSNKYHILAAGLVGQDSQDIWKIENTADLSAAMRLSSLSGVFDFYVIPEGGNENDVQLYRRNLSNYDDQIKKTLWY
jgi:S1-C subfamily serine protease